MSTGCPPAALLASLTFTACAKHARVKAVQGTRIPGIWQTVVIVFLLGVTGCSKTSTTAPEPVVPPVVSSEYRYSAGSFYADSGYTMKTLEYADADGVVRKVDFPAPLWRQSVSLKPGDRMYVRAEIEFPSILAGRIQVVGPPGFYAGDLVERTDGPATAVLVIDQIVK